MTALLPPEVAPHAAEFQADGQDQSRDHEDWVRFGGIKIRTEEPYLALKNRAASGKWVRGWVARQKLAAENNARRRAIERAVELGGFDIPGATPGPRGTPGRGGGRTRVVSRLPEWRATSTQVAGGFWPFSVGATSPMLGTPLGSHLFTGQDFGCDPLSWFLGGQITAPIAFVLALNGFGKSSLVRRMALGNIAQGHTSLFLGDIKPDYVGLTEAVEGQVITGGYGHQQINPLAVGALGEAITHLTDDDQRQRALEDLRSRQVSTVAGLVEISRGAPVEDFEETLLGSAIDTLYRPKGEGGRGFTGDKPPILADLYEVVKTGDAGLWEDAGARNENDYAAIAADLRRSLRALVRGRLGKVLNGQTTTPIDLESPAVCIDVSRVPKGDKKLKAALLLVCWSDGFGAVEAAHVLADAGLSRRRTFQVVIDELWQVIGSGAGIVDRVDSLVRLNRSDAVSLIMCTHSVNDLSAFDSPADAAKAIGFLEKAQLKFIGPIGPEEVERLSQVTSFNAMERSLITSAASTPPPSEQQLARLRRHLRSGDGALSAADRPRPHGQGLFIAKFGGSDESRPGVPFRMHFTPTEASGGVHDTNARFQGVLRSQRPE